MGYIYSGDNKSTTEMNGSLLVGISFVVSVMNQVSRMALNKRARRQISESQNNNKNR